MGSPVYLGYDQEALDRQYNNQQRIARFAEHVAGWKAGSERARAELKGFFDVAFGPSPAETVDVFVPDQPGGPAPVHVFYHGGYWRAFEARDFSFVARPFVEAGAVAVIVNYALLPTVRMGELVRQCRAALAWVERNIAPYGGDPRQIHISGHSAGGHLVAQVLARDPDQAFALPDVKSAVAISGVYDLEPMRLCFLQETLQLTPEEVRRYGAVLNPPAVKAPLAVIYGGEESEEFARQADAFAAASRRRGIECPLQAMPERHHMSILTAATEKGSDVARVLLAPMGLG